MYVRAHLDLLQQKPLFMNVANTKKGQNEIDDESYDGSVCFYGFRGCRDKHGVKLKHLELKIREDMERTFINEPLMRSGHVALSADDGNTAYGFNPIVPHGMPIKDAFKLLFENEAFAGQISDDTEVFQHAKCFENHGWNTKVAEIRLAVPKWFQTSVQKVLIGLSQIEDGSHGYKYAYPYRTQNGNGHYFADPATTGNCATFFSTCLGIDVPGITTGNGSMRCIMPLMERIDSTQVLSNIGQETYSNNSIYENVSHV